MNGNAFLLSGTMAAALILIILTLMLSMSVRLMLARRKNAYFSLSLSLLLIAVQYILIIALGNRAELPDMDGTEAERYIIYGLKTVSFIVINLGIYQLYNPTRNRVRLVAYLGCLIAFSIMGAQYYAASKMLTDPSEVALLPANAFLNVWMDLYLFAVIFFCFYFITPAVGQSIKYQLAIIVYFLSHSSYLLNEYVFGGKAAGLTVVENFLPVLYFFVIFQILFDRVLELMDAVYNSAITDGLTGLFNRRFFTRQLQKYVAAQRPVSVIFCDIDNFKKLNDTEGHQRGDDVLRHVAAIVKEEAEEIGIPGRYGGEEIVMVLTEPRVDPAKTAERVRARVEAEAGVTVSVGWSKYRKGITSEKLVKEADEAMYLSKTQGKNRVTAYSARTIRANEPGR